jgi:hypothetical protein
MLEPVEKHKCENDHENNALLTYDCELRGSSPVEISATRSASRRELESAAQMKKPRNDMSGSEFERAIPTPLS